MKYEIGRRWFIGSLIGGGVGWLISENLIFGMAMFAGLLMPQIIKIYIPYANDNPHHLWFKRKIYGWGWTPVTWEGWLSIIIYITFLIVTFRWAGAYSHSANETFYKVVLPLAILTAGLIYLLYKKGEKPHWQWGQVSTK